MSHDHPYIDFDGDGHGDTYTTSDLPDGGHAFSHHDAHGNIDAIAYDHDHDGLVDTLDVDNDHDGVLDHHLTDTTGDGWMDTKVPIEHPEPEADPDRMVIVHTADGGDAYVHGDGHGHADTIGWDFEGDGRLDAIDVDSNHDGILDQRFVDAGDPAGPHGPQPFGTHPDGTQPDGPRPEEPQSRGYETGFGYASS